MSKSPMRGRTAAALVAVCALAMLALAVLYAFAPELRSGANADANSLSQSAVGFAGLKDLLTLSGIETLIDRGPIGRDNRKPSLTILTPNAVTSARALAAYKTAGPVLVILPKWTTARLPTHVSWVVKTGVVSVRTIYNQLQPLAGSVLVTRHPGNIQGSTTSKGGFAPDGLATPSFGPVEDIQVTQGNPVLVAGSYGAVMSVASFMPRVTIAPVYVLAEPDLMNNQGLSNRQTAAAAVAIIRSLRSGNGPVRMDVTLDGLANAPSILRSAFEPPFLGATLCAVLAALLMGLHSAFRFGAPLREIRVFARGKKALADNSAALVRMMGREGAMAPRYVAAARNLVLERLGARRAAPVQQDALLATLGRGGETYSALAGEAAAAQSGSDLLRIAQKTYAWRRRISGGH